MIDRREIDGIVYSIACMVGGASVGWLVSTWASALLSGTIGLLSCSVISFFCYQALLEGMEAKIERWEKARRE